MVTYFKKTQKPFKCNNCANAKNVENNEQFLWENSEHLLNAKNRFYKCSKQIWIYSKNDV